MGLNARIRRIERDVARVERRLAQPKPWDNVPGLEHSLGRARALLKSEKARQKEIRRERKGGG